MYRLNFPLQQGFPATDSSSHPLHYLCGIGAVVMIVATEANIITSTKLSFVNSVSVHGLLFPVKGGDFLLMKSSAIINIPSANRTTCAY